MVTAYIMVEVESGTENDVAASVKKKSGVKDVGIVYGEYDIVLKVEVGTMEDLQNFVLSLRKEKGIRRTTTMIAV
jgi:DNA-binding Lrp family transcriptional regulator